MINFVSSFNWRIEFKFHKFVQLIISHLKIHDRLGLLWKENFGMPLLWGHHKLTFHFNSNCAMHLFTIWEYNQGFDNASYFLILCFSIHNFFILVFELLRRKTFLCIILLSLHYHFQSKKIVENNFDKLPFHGLGKDHSSTWWKALAAQLMTHGIRIWAPVFPLNIVLWLSTELFLIFLTFVNCGGYLSYNNLNSLPK